MKISIDVDPTQLNDSLLSILSSLSIDEKKDIAKQTVIQWLADPVSIESQLEFKKAFDRTKQHLSRSWSHSVSSDVQVLDSYQFSTELNKSFSSKDVLISLIRSEVLAFYKEHVKELIKSDPDIQQQLKNISAEVAKDFPNYIKTALVYHFCQNMQNLSDNVQSLMLDKEYRDNLPTQDNSR